MKNKKKDNIINFPASASKLERQIEAILFAASEPLDLENVVEAVQAPAPQVNPQAFGSLFPQDTLGQAIANRGNRRG